VRVDEIERRLIRYVSWSIQTSLP